MSATLPSDRLVPPIAVAAATLMSTEAMTSWVTSAPIAVSQRA